MKKLILALSFLLIFMSATPAFAQGNVEADKNNILKLKNMFNISNDYEKFNFTTSNSNKDLKLNYSWSSKNNNNINITTDKEGNVLSYNKYIEEENSATNIKSKNEIEDISKSYLNKIDLNILNEYSATKFNIDIKSNFADFYYQRKVNDTVVLDDYITLQINLNNGELTNFSRSKEKIVKNKDFPKKTEIISDKKAKEILTKEEPYHLAYLVTYKDEKISIPIYAQLANNSAIDAQSGKLLDIETEMIPLYKEAMAEDSAESSELSQVEENEIKKIKSLKNIAEYKSFIERNFLIKDLKFDNYSLLSIDDKYIYSITYSNSENNPKLDFLFDAKELELISFNSMFYNNEKKGKISDDESINIANEFMKKFFKDKERVDLENPIVTHNDYTTNVIYNRVENKSYVKNNNVSITINNEDKEINNFRVNFDNVAFNPITEKIKIEDAYKDAFEIGEFNLYYIYDKDTPKLVYTFKDNHSPILLAKDGKQIDNSGNLIIKNDIIYKDIKKSKYSDEIQYLKDLNIGVPEVTDLKSKIKEKEFLYLVQSVFSQIDYSTESIENIYNYPGSFEINKSDIARKDNNTKNNFAIKIMVNANGYNNLENINNIFKDDLFTDQKTLPHSELPYFAMAKALSIYNEQKANPNRELTHEDALHLVYSFYK